MKNVEFKVKSFTMKDNRKENYNRKFVIPFTKKELHDGDFADISLYKVCEAIFNEFEGNVPYDIVKNLKLISIQDHN